MYILENAPSEIRNYLKPLHCDYVTEQNITYQRQHLSPSIYLQLANSTVENFIIHVTFTLVKMEDVQVKFFQKHLLLHQLTQNMRKYCSWNYEFSTLKFPAQNMLCT